MLQLAETLNQIINFQKQIKIRKKRPAKNFFITFCHLLEYNNQQFHKAMKPGTKSRKICLEIPTVNPCNDFIVDFLIRNKIKSDKQVLCKSYLYNLAIEAVRKYPLPLICEEQLAALQGFGNFFIGQVGRLIKKHYSRGRLPTEKEMEEDDEAHFEALRAKSKKEEEIPINLIYGTLHKDPEPQFGNIKKAPERRRYYRPKRNTEPFNILEALIKLRAWEKGVTKGDINQVLFMDGKQKIRLWFVLRAKLQEFQFIELDPKNEDYIYLTRKGKHYIQNFDKEEQERARRGRRRSKGPVEGEEYSEDEEEVKQSEVKEQFVKLQSEVYNEQSKTPISSKSKTKSTTASEIKPPKSNSQMEMKKTFFARNTNFDEIRLLVSDRSMDGKHMETLLERFNDLNYEICKVEFADFLWSADGRILDYMAIRIKQSEFDQENLKTICYRAKMTTCQTVFLIIENNQVNVKLEDSAENSQLVSNERKNQLLMSVIASGIRVIRTRNLKQTLQFASAITNQIVKKLQLFQNNGQLKKIRKDSGNQPFVEDIKFFGSLEKFNKKIRYPYEYSTVTTQCLKCIPDLTLKCIKILVEKFPTLAILYRKTLDSETTKEKRLLLRSLLIDQKVPDLALNTLVQLISYEAY